MEPHLVRSSHGRHAPRVIGVILSLCLALPAYAQQNETPELDGLQVATAMQSALIQSIARAEKSVVAIARVRKDTAPDPSNLQPGRFVQPRTLAAQPGNPDFIPNEYATGVAIDEGLILTANHVLADNSEYWITTHDRRHFQARVKGADPRGDLAVLEIDTSDLTPIPFGDGSSLKKGQIVIALGNPYSIARDGQVSASWGIVSNLSRKAPPNTKNETDSGKDQLYHFGTLIQTDAKLNLGTSGGALLNLSGEMVGLTTSLAALTGYDQAAGYAIPVDDTFRRAVQMLKQGREVEYGLLGVVPENLMQREIENGRTGARVQSVVAGMPAHEAGLEAGDVITHVEGELVRDADELMLGIGRRAAEAEVQLRLLRGEKQLVRNVRLAKFGVTGRKIITAPADGWRGLQIDHASSIPARHYSALAAQGRIDPRGCVLIAAVDPDSPAAQAELEPGMFITHVDSKPVRSPREFRSAVAGKRGEVKLQLTLRSDQRPSRIVAAPAD